MSVPSDPLTSSAARVAGIRRRCRFEDAERAARELDDRRGRVFDLDRMQPRRRPRGHLRHGAEQPVQQVDRVDALIHQRAAAVERPRAPPARRRVVFRRTEPPDAPRREDRRAHTPRRNHRLHRRDVGLEAILEEHADLDPLAVRFGDDGIHLRGRDVQRLFRDDVQAALDRRDRLFGVKTRRAADRHDVERMVIEEATDVGVGRAAVRRREALGFLAVRPAHRRDLDTRDRLRGARVRVADVAGAEQSDPNHSLRILMLRYHTWSPWSCRRMWPFCGLPKRSMPLNLLFSMAASDRRAAELVLEHALSVQPVLDVACRGRRCAWCSISPAGLTGRSAAGSTS